MDCSQMVEFDYVKYEKAKAMARYNRFRKISKFLQFLEVLVALALISWSSTFLPGVFKVFGEFFLEVLRYICNPHVAFLIGNVIVAVLFFLRRENDAAGNDSTGDLYDDYVQHSERSKVYVPDEIRTVPRATLEIKELTTATTTAAAADAAVADYENYGGGDAEEKQIICFHSEEKCDPVTTAIETATKQIEKFQRTQSVKLKREMTAKPRPAELRRSETVRVGGSQAERLGMMTSLERVDKLSDEEFNRTIDAYIKNHQKSLMEQKLAETQVFKTDIRKNSNYICAR